MEHGVAQSSKRPSTTVYLISEDEEVVPHDPKPYKGKQPARPLTDESAEETRKKSSKRSRTESLQEHPTNQATAPMQRKSKKEREEVFACHCNELNCRGCTAVRRKMGLCDSKLKPSILNHITEIEKLSKSQGTDDWNVEIGFQKKGGRDRRSKSSDVAGQQSRSSAGENLYWTGRDGWTISDCEKPMTVMRTGDLMIRLFRKD